MSAGIAGSTLKAPKTFVHHSGRKVCRSTSSPASISVWGVFIYNHHRRIFEHCFERDHPFHSPKERLMSCDSPIANCGINATCGIFIRMCAIFSLSSLDFLIIFLIPKLMSAFSSYLYANSRFFPDHRLPLIASSPDYRG